MKLTLTSKPSLSGGPTASGVNNQPVSHAFTVSETSENCTADFVESLQMTQEKDGSFAALIPVAIPTGSAASDEYIATLATLKLRAESSTAKSGTRRVLVAVTLPYFSLDPEQYASGIKRISPARSGKSMTAHVVLTLPKEVEQDIKGLYTGDPGTCVAKAQIAALLGVLRTLVGVVGSEFGASTPLTVEWEDSPDGTWLRGTFNKSASPDHLPRAVMATKAIAGYEGLVGLEMPKLSAEATQDTTNILLRAISGLPPIDSNSELGVRPAEHAASDTHDNLFSCEF